MGQNLLFLSEHPELFCLYAAAFGLLIGSFLNVVILRLPPRMEWQWRQEAREVLGGQADTAPRPPGLAMERSHCPACGHRLGWWENIPLLSYLFLKGRCRSCQKRISLQYPLVEGLTGALFLACAAAFGPGWMFMGGLIFCSLLVASCVIDLRTCLLPDALVYPLLWAGLAWAAGGIPGAISPAAAIGGAIIGYLSLWTVYWVFKLATGKEGMGFGDFKLLAALGAWCGPMSILPIVLVSTLAGIAIGGAAMAIQGRDRATPFAFGPFLAVGGLVEFFWRGGLMDLLTALAA